VSDSRLLLPQLVRGVVQLALISSIVLRDPLFDLSPRYFYEVF
jgi:hypothetical protein